MYFQEWYLLGPSVGSDSWALLWLCEEDDSRNSDQASSRPATLHLFQQPRYRDYWDVRSLKLDLVIVIVLLWTCEMCVCMSPTILNVDSLRHLNRQIADS